MSTENVRIFSSKAAMEHGPTQTFQLVVNSAVKKAPHSSAQTILSDPFRWISIAFLTPIFHVEIKFDLSE